MGFSGNLENYPACQEEKKEWEETFEEDPRLLLKDLGFRGFRGLGV